MKEEYHYVYKIQFSEVAQTYFGSRTSRCIPECDTSYLGSPKAYKVYWQLYTPHKTILATFNTREEAFTYEANLIRKQWNIDKHLSLNAHIPGEQFSTKGKKLSQKQLDAIRKSHLGRPKTQEELAAMTKPYFMVSPTGEIFQGINIRRFCRANGFDKTSCRNVMNGSKFHVKGWTGSLKAHNLYLEVYNDRGLYWIAARSQWRIRWFDSGKEKTRFFKNKSDALSFRDSLENQYGYEIMVMCRNWKARLEAMQSEAA